MVMNGQSGRAIYRPRETDTSWIIRADDGMHIATHVRRPINGGGKKMIWAVPDEKDPKKLLMGLDGVPTADLPLYNSEHINDWANMPIFICEGEKAADALVKLDLAAVATVTGAAGIPAVHVLEVLVGRRVVLWPDNDTVGRKHMEQISHRLRGVASEVFYIEPPEDSPKGWDAADGVTYERATALYSEALDRGPGILAMRRHADSLANMIRERGIPSEDTAWACDEAWKPGSLTLVVGAQQSMKSWAMFDLGYHALLGTDWLEHRLIKYDQVVYVSNEKGTAAIYERLHKIFGERLDLAERMFVLHREYKLFIGTPSWKELVDRVHDGSRKLIILDTLTSLVKPGYNENDLGDVSRMLASIRDLQDGELNDVMLVHHLRADGERPRGHTALEGEVDGFVRLGRKGLDIPEVTVRFEPKDGTTSVDSFLWDPETGLFRRRPGAMLHMRNLTEIVRWWFERNSEGITARQVRDSYFKKAKYDEIVASLEEAVSQHLLRIEERRSQTSNREARLYVPLSDQESRTAAEQARFETSPEGRRLAALVDASEQLQLES